MKTVAQQLSDYINDQDGYEIMTGNGITISAWDEWLLHAQFILVATENVKLKLSLCCSKKSFVEILEIRTLPAIYELTQERLMELFYEGLAELICDVYLEKTHFMVFQNLGDGVIAENEREIKHTIPVYEKPEAPDQFIAYALQYYKLMECNVN